MNNKIEINKFHLKIKNKFNKKPRSQRAYNQINNRAVFNKINRNLILEHLMNIWLNKIKYNLMIPTIKIILFLSSNLK